jgi:hypothetical protein
MSSRSFGAQHAKLSHLLDGKGGIPGEVADLRQDTELGFENHEGQVGFPMLDWLVGAEPAVGGATVVFRGRALLQGQSFDTLTLVSGTSNLIITALKPGKSGIKVVVLTAAGAASVAFTGGVLTIQPAAGGSTASAIATLINANGAACQGVLWATVVVGDATPFTLAVASTPLAGGVGAYAGNVVTFSGVEALPKNTTGATGAAAWTDTVLTVSSPNLSTTSPAHNTGDKVAAVIESNGTMSAPLTIQLGGGTAGATGATGPSGATGPTGPTGVTGPSGHS